MTMDNVFNKAAGAGSNRKFSNQPKSSRFSPSYGVRKGFIKDPNWPPAEFPAEGMATSRRFRRIPAAFEVSVGGLAPVKVTGNLSSGGVMFALENVLTSEKIEVVFGGHKAAAEVIASESKGPLFIYRAHFTDLDAASEIWVALMKLN
jgi:hypothetical protein